MATAPSRPMMIDHLSGRDNNLNLVRMLAAAAVLVSHAFPIALGPGAVEPLDEATGKSLGWIAVAIFFSLSGLLIANSFSRSKGWARFVVARVLRLFPALFVVLVLTVIAGAFLTDLGTAEYFLAVETWTYIPRNLSLAMLQYPLPGVFEDNAYPAAINGSLWTLFYEVTCYTLLFLAGILGILRHRWLVTAIVAVLGAAYIATLFIEQPGQVLFAKFYILITLAFPFSLGVLVFAWREKMAFDLRVAALLWLVCLPSLYTVIAPFFFLLAVTYTVGWFGFVPKGRLLAYNKVGDYSYGIYIYAFPMQQLMSHLFPGSSPVTNMLLAAPPTLIMAILSWHLVEERALSRIKPIAAMLQPGAARAVSAG